MAAIRILLAEREGILRELLEHWLDAQEGMEVVAATGDGQEALDGARDLRPDVVLVDLFMPGLSGIELAAILKEDAPTVSVAILSGMPEERLLLRALQAGTSGFILKDTSCEELLSAVRVMARGDRYFSPWALEVMAERLRRPHEADPSLRLTPRERQVLQLIAKGRTMKEVAFELDISPKTAYMHRANLMKRVNCLDVSGLVQYARRLDFAPPSKGAVLGSLLPP